MDWFWLGVKKRDYELRELEGNKFVIMDSDNGSFYGGEEKYE